MSKPLRKKKPTTWTDYAHAVAMAKVPNKITVKAFRQVKNPLHEALDLGCGTGKDSLYLLKKGFLVDSVDSNPTCLSYFERSIPEKLKRNSRRFRRRMENLKPQKQYSLVIAQRTLPFVPRARFNATFRRALSCVAPQGVFSAILFGQRDDWATSPHVVTVNPRAIKKQLKNFTVVHFKERIYKAPTALGAIKQWHEIEIIAVRKSRSS